MNQNLRFFALGIAGQIIGIYIYAAFWTHDYERAAFTSAILLIVGAGIIFPVFIISKFYKEISSFVDFCINYFKDAPHVIKHALSIFFAIIAIVCVAPFLSFRKIYYNFKGMLC